MYSIFDLDEYLKTYNLLGTASQYTYDFDINDETIYANKVDLEILKETVEFCNFKYISSIDMPVVTSHYFENNNILSKIIHTRIQVFNQNTIHEFILDNMLRERVWIYALKFFKRIDDKFLEQGEILHMMIRCETF